MWIMDENITTNQVCGFIAQILSKDLAVNNFAFEGFPQINVRYDADAFFIQLRINEHLSSEVPVQFDFVIRSMDKYKVDGSFEDPFFKSMQGLVQELEIKRSASIR